MSLWKGRSSLGMGVSLRLVVVVVLYLAGVVAGRSSRVLPPPEANTDPDIVLEAGYPGWEPTQPKPAPQTAQGRFLYYRKNPKVEKHRSAVHELYMRPYNYALLDHHAVAVLAGEKVRGVVHFYQLAGPTAPVNIVGNITGLAPGAHGFHVHQLGDTTDGCKSMEGHFNPFQVRHGAPEDLYRHAGDLGNIVADAEGVARFELTDRQISLNGLNSIIGRGVVIHADTDDLGRGGNDDSLKTGNAGGRIACAVIGRSSDVV